MASNPLECDVCCNEFSVEHCPRILPCSHSFCYHCLERIIQGQSKSCPSCRENITAVSADNIPINRNLLEAANRSSSAATPVAGSGDVLGDILTQNTRSLFLYQDEIELLSEKKEIFASIQHLLRMKEGTVEMIKELEEIKCSKAKILNDIIENVKLLKNKFDLLESDKRVEVSNVDELQSTTDSALSAIIPDRNEMKNIKELLRNVATQRDDIVKDILKVKIRIGKIVEKSEEGSGADPQAIYAVKNYEDKELIAPVKIWSKTKVAVNHLEEGLIPPDSLTIKHESLMGSYSRRAFLDVAVEGKSLGRVIIKVMDEWNFALNFLHLCAGDLGFSYAHSCFLRVNRYSNFDTVTMGKYNVLGGTSSEAVLSGVDWNSECKSDIYKKTKWEEGDVMGDFCYEKNVSEFSIATRVSKSMSNWGYFGRVEYGLDILKDIVSRYSDNVSCVQVVNCGLIVSP